LRFGLQNSGLQAVLSPWPGSISPGENPLW
jgi:hypothetical protein